MRGTRAMIAALAVCALAGCASVTGGNVQKMYVQAQMDDGTAVAGADCMLSNDKGRWPVRAPGDASIVRSNKPMEVKCEKPSLPAGVVSVESGTRAAMFGNILLGGVVGAAIDHSSGAAYEYPEQVHVVMGRMTSKPWVPGAANAPPPTGFAMVGDADKVPYLGAKGREAYKQWVGRPNPKAFAVAPNGYFHAAWGERPGDPTLPYDVSERSLTGCERAAKMKCKLYAVNGDVVWTRDSAPAAALVPAAAPAPVAAPTPAAAPAPAAPTTIVSTTLVPPAPRSAQPAHIASGYAAIDDIDAVPYLSDRGRDSYRDWLAHQTPRAFALSPKGHWGAAWGLNPTDTTLPTDPTERALFVCSQRAQAPCRLYAVNGAVVWTKETRVSQP